MRQDELRIIAGAIPAAVFAFYGFVWWLLMLDADAVEKRRKQRREGAHHGS